MLPFMDEAPFISVIIPAWDDEKVIGATLDALKDFDYPKKRCEIIVIAGGSDNTYVAAEKYSEIMKDFSRYVLLKQTPHGKNAAPNPRSRNKPKVFIASNPIATKPKSDGSSNLAKIILVMNSKILTIKVEKTTQVKLRIVFFAKVMRILH